MPTLEEIKTAYADAGIEDKMGVKAAQVKALFEGCQECWPSGEINPYVLKALVGGVERGEDRVCGCHPYVVTRDMYEAACEALARLPFAALRPPCGYGWVLYDALGAPIFVEPVPHPPPPGPDDQPPPGDDGAEETPQEPVATKASPWPILAFMAAVGAAVFVGAKAMEGPGSRRNPAGRASGPGRREVERAVGESLTPELLHSPYREKVERGECDPVTGHCYVASEAAFHMLGGKASGYRPMFIRHEGSPHWFLRGPEGEVVDITAAQFEEPVPYGEGVGKGFLTREPSRRARVVIERAERKL